MKLPFSRTPVDRERLERRIASHWDRRAGGRPGRPWWESLTVVRHINRLVCGEPLSGLSAGLRTVAREQSASRHLERGVSVGGGIGSKEIGLLREDIVQRFEIFELSHKRIERGQALAAKLGLADRLTFRREDAFASVTEASVDLVHWNNSLHHMLDVEEAVAWSCRILRPGGLFYMDDYVGPARFQWPKESLAFANGVRSLLPERFFPNPLYPEHGRVAFSREVHRPEASRIAAEDPSEAAQSDRILAAVKRYFPTAEITLTGGVVYHLALSGILLNFDEDNEKDRGVLESLMVLDELSLESPGIPSHYATALAWTI